MTETTGLLVVDKPPAYTSHDVVAKCRRIFGQRRVGHAGTLDPGATGVLVVGLGQATRLLKFVSGLPKSYSAEVVFGTATSTLDSAGEVTGTWDMADLTLDQVRAAAEQLTGRLMQVPPMVSAIKIGGRRLHELARRGIEVERPARLIEVFRFEVGPVVAQGCEEAASGRGPVVAISVSCSSGTYIRSLAADLGQALGGGAHLRALRRLAVGEFTVEESVTLDALEKSPVALPVLEAVRGMARIVVDDDTAACVAHGKVLSERSLIGVVLGEGGPWALVSGDGNLLAVYERYRDDQIKPVVVLAAA